MANFISDPPLSPNMASSPLSMDNISIVLVNPESSGNIGSIARVMKNFGLSNLVLFNPQEKPLSDYAKGFAMKAVDLLEGADVIYSRDFKRVHKSFRNEKAGSGQISDKNNLQKGDKIKEAPNHEDFRNLRSTRNLGMEELKNIFHRYDVVIGTSAKGISYKNIKRVPVLLNELDFSPLAGNPNIAIVFGRESTGLTNDELLLTDFLLRIPTDSKYPTLNISQAVGIILYRIRVLLWKEKQNKNKKKERESNVSPENKKKQSLAPHKLNNSNSQKEVKALNLNNQNPEGSGLRGQVIPAEKKEKDRLLTLIKKTIQLSPVERNRQDRAFHALKNIIGRSFISHKEVSELYYLYQKIRTGFKNPDILKKRED